MTTDCFISVRDVQHSLLCDGYIITATTDIPCHLYMRWSTTKPQKHIVPAYRRGIYMHGDVYLCFVAYRDNEQEEAGDTLTHTFIKKNWQVCETRYFHFWGKVAGQPCRSTSAIFQLHFNILLETFLGTWSNRTIAGTHGTWSVAHDATSGRILTNYKAPYYIIVAGDELTASFWIYRGFLFFNTSSLPVGTEIAGAYLDIFVTWHRPLAPGAAPWLGITEGVQNDPVIPTNYGDQLPYTTIGGSKTLGSMTDGQFNRITFNQDGLPFIKPGGITKLCLRGGHDIGDSPPGLGTYYARFYSAQKTSEYAPRLTVCVPPK